MASLARKWSHFVLSLKVGFFLAVRELKRANVWTTGLIVMIMVLTFLNLVVVSGILVGLIDGIVERVHQTFSGDVFITALPNKRYINNSQDIIRYLDSLTEVKKYTVRYTEGGRVEANYNKIRKADELPETAAAMVSGIDPVQEENFAGISEYVVEGSYLSPDDYDKVLVGANLLYKYTPIDSPDYKTLKNVGIGTKIRLTIGTTTREVTVKGIMKSKVDSIDMRVLMVDTQFRNIINRYDYNVDEIAIKIQPNTTPERVKALILGINADRYSTVQTAEESEPKFVKDIKDTFAILGNFISSIGLAVASITIFIVIFVNAITRRRYIGILKGIGIDSTAIEISYVVQSLFYAFLGTVIGMVIVFAILKPYFDANPIDFPFSDGILVASISGTLARGFILLAATIIAGYIPARIVIKQNTLNAILGR